MGETPPPLPKESNAELSPRLRRDVLTGAALLIVGVLLIAAAAVIDLRDTEDAAWPGTIYSLRGKPPWDGTIAIRARWLPLVNYPIRQEIYTRLKSTMNRDELEATGLRRTELLIVVDMKAQELEPLLASGRMPHAGEPEVVAGAFASLNEVHADDAHLRVVGRLKRNVAGLATAYIMPYDETWEPLWDKTTTVGWLDPNGAEKLRSADQPQKKEDGTEILGGPAASSAVSSGVCMIGLALMMAGGARMHRAVFDRMGKRGITGPARNAFGEHPRVVRGMHTWMYGAFVVSMAMAIAAPQFNAMAMEYVRHAFTEGGLSYVGDAYRAGNIIHAAAATWVNNYLLQTVLLTVLISIVLPCIGLLKTLASFVVAGVGMAPIWSGMAASYTYHSITMVLELEAYIYACAAVAIFWIRIFRASRQRSLAPIREGFTILGSAMLLCGVMLAVAGLYEATTLILLR